MLEKGVRGYRDGASTTAQVILALQFVHCIATLVAVKLGEVVIPTEVEAEGISHAVGTFKQLVHWIPYQR